MTTGAAVSFEALVDGSVHLGLLLGLAFGESATLSLSACCGAVLALARLVRTERQELCLNAVPGPLLALSVVSLWM